MIRYRLAPVLILAVLLWFTATICHAEGLISQVPVERIDHSRLEALSELSDSSCWFYVAHQQRDYIWYRLDLTAFGVGDSLRWPLGQCYVLMEYEFMGETFARPVIARSVVFPYQGPCVVLSPGTRYSKADLTSRGRVRGFVAVYKEDVTGHPVRLLWDNGRKAGTF